MTADQTGEFPQPGWALVRTNGIVADGVYDLDTSSDGYYLTLLADPDQNVWDYLDGRADSISEEQP